MVQTRFQTPPQASCPTCGGAMVEGEGAFTCPICGCIWEHRGDRSGEFFVRKESTWRPRPKSRRRS